MIPKSFFKWPRPYQLCLNGRQRKLQGVFEGTDFQSESLPVYL